MKQTSDEPRHRLHHSGRKKHTLEKEILTEQRYNELMGQYESEALRAGFHLEFPSAWFQPKDQPEYTG